MKRIAIIIIGSLAIAGLAAAQPFGGGAPGAGPGGQGGQYGANQNPPQAQSFEGKLVFVDKIPAIQTKDKTYLLRMPEFFENAYFDGIKEGAAIKADGYLVPALPGQDKPWFFATKAVINGKTYDYTTQGFGRGGMRGGFGPRGGFDGMMGGQGQMGGGRGW